MVIFSSSKGSVKKALKKVPFEEKETSPAANDSDNEKVDDIFKKWQQPMDHDDDGASEASASEHMEVDESEDEEEMMKRFQQEMDRSDDDDDNDHDAEEEDKEDVEDIEQDIEQYKKDLEALKDTDPEFYKYLEKEDKELLEFDEGVDDMADSEEEIPSDIEEEPADVEDVEFSASVPALSKTMLNEWIDSIKTNKDFKAFKKLLQAFKTAARMSEEDEEEMNFSYKIEDPAVFSKVIISALRYAPVVFAHHLKPKKEGGSPMTSGRWSFFKTYVKTYLNNLLHLLRNLTDADMIRLAIREAEKCTHLFVCYDRLSKEYLKALLHAWASPTSADMVRVQAFLSIKSLAVAPVPAANKYGAKGYLDMCLKNVYLTYVKNCKNTNMHTLPVINMMRNLAVQLYGIHPTLSYQQAFVYIRQLAIYLRQAMKVHSQKNHNMVYNWQYIHCIDFWVDVLNAYATARMVDAATGEPVGDSPLKPLIYPLCQVAVGVMQLIPTAQFYPLRFHLLRTMTSLIHHTNTYIPLANFVIEVMESKVAMDMAKKTDAGNPTDWDLVLRVNKKILHSRMYQDEVLEQCAKALSQFYKEFYSQSGFREMVDPDIITIRRFLKKSKASLKGKEKLKALVKELENVTKTAKNTIETEQ
ncbi:Noc2p family-domain-containing protein [Mycotypha africana]|uniref:Noc2p family-domain-containing protein n=1 Tax=Mycotypha africana TaxID=64632 RepID=UPI002300A582|nr:Noc2p family-domain-containing protein [Mycotypha africana]KAI8982076.1 Noc2p family-domain-containing protein [Mycotypha africana]